MFQFLSKDTCLPAKPRQFALLRSRDVTRRHTLRLPPDCARTAPGFPRGVAHSRERLLHRLLVLVAFCSRQAHRHSVLLWTALCFHLSLCLFQLLFIFYLTLKVIIKACVCLCVCVYTRQMLLCFRVFLLLNFLLFHHPIDLSYLLLN